jgi:hypothetical protein
LSLSLSLSLLPLPLLPPPRHYCSTSVKEEGEDSNIIVLIAPLWHGVDTRLIDYSRRYPHDRYLLVLSSSDVYNHTSSYTAYRQHLM